MVLRHCQGAVRGEPGEHGADYDEPHHRRGGDCDTVILGFVLLPPSYWLAVVVILMSYAVLTHIMKTWFVLRFGLN
jgi:hypothetical protein